MLPNIYNELTSMNTIKQKVYHNINHIKFKLEAVFEMNIDNMEFYFVDNGVQNGLCIPILIKVDDDAISIEDIYDSLHHIPFYKINTPKTLNPINKISQDNNIIEVKKLNEDEEQANKLTIDYLVGLLKNKDITDSIKRVKKECGLKIINISKDSRFIPYVNNIALVSNLDMYSDDNVVVVDYREFQIVEKGQTYKSIGTFKIKDGKHVYDKSHLALVAECISCHQLFVFDYYEGIKKVCPKCSS